LLLDVAVMKGIIVDLPTLTNSRTGPKTVPARYSSYVTKEIAKAEKILKVINSFSEYGQHRGPKDVEIPANTFVQLLPKAKDPLFIRLLDIKGIPKSEQQPYIQAYSRAKQVDEQLRKHQSEIAKK
jgi:vacuolar protein sorting-associated protein 53